MVSILKGHAHATHALGEPFGIPTGSGVSFVGLVFIDIYHADYEKKEKTLLALLPSRLYNQKLLALTFEINGKCTGMALATSLCRAVALFC